jgi:parallel beta-helix repeat protein
MASNTSTSLLATSDSFVVHLSEDAYLGDAQFTFSVDGVQVGGIQSVSAIHSAGASQAFTFSGSFGSGTHVAAVTFLNDAYGGTASTDRNLYVDAIEYDGTSVASAKALLASAGTSRFNVAAGAAATATPTPTPTATTGANSLVLHVAEDAYQGDAQFIVKVDGVQVGGVQSATASHAAGQSQAITLNGAFGTGSHQVAVTFINDAWGGTAATDRNLYVSGIDFNGVANAGATAGLFSNGTANLTVTDAAAAVVAPAAAAQDTLTLSMAEDAYLGDAQFTVKVDGVAVGGVNTVSTLHSSGASQMFNLTGNFGTGTHDVAVTFINDAYGGSASTDRNLFVNGVAYNGTANQASGTLSSNGTLHFSISGAAASSTPVVVAPVTTPVITTPVVTTPVVTTPVVTTPVVTVPVGTTPTLTTLASLLPTPSGKALYVSASGNDSGDGSAAHPYASLQAAVSASEATGIKTINVQAGNYSQYAPVALGTRDAGLSIIGSGDAVIDGHGSANGLFTLNNASGITIAGLTLENTASSTILMIGSSGNSIVGNHILNTATSGIEVVDYSNNNKIDNNWIDGIGAPETGGGGIYVHGGSYNTLTHNQIQHAKGSGIALLDFMTGSTLTQNIGNTIAYNRVLDTDQTANDSGGIYILGRTAADTQTTVTMNFVQGVGGAGRHNVGIYLDDDTNGVTVTKNIVAGAGSDALQVHGGSNNHFSGNIFDLGNINASSAGFFQAAPSEQIQNAMVNNDFTGNIVISSASQPRNPLFPIDNGGNPTISGNDYWSTVGAYMNTSQDSAAQHVDPGISSGNYGGVNGAGIGFSPINLAAIGNTLFNA